MGNAMRGLTTRGKTLVMVGLAMIATTFLIGEKDLLRVALLVGLLPLASVFVLSRTKYQLVTQRQLSPPRISAGQQTRVTLRLRNQSRFPTGSMMLEDRLPYSLGTRPRLVLERLLGGGGSAVHYTVQPQYRGRYELGPLVVRLTDPFGLVELAHSYPTTDHLTVTPQITALPTIRFAGDYSGSGQHRSGVVAVHGEDDAATREYRHGDDLRRVHWPSTARSGDLMVRREEQPWEAQATVLLDVRAKAHHGEGPAASFEWAVSAAASVTTHLRLSGYKTRLVTESADISGDDAEAATMDYLSAVQPQDTAQAASEVERVRRRASGGLIVAVFGSLSAEETAQLGALHQSGATCVALLIDSTTWLRLAEAARAEADRAMRESTATLMRHGWQVMPIRNGDQLAAAWRQLAAGQQGGAR